jgi:hypothetical protein
MYRRKRGSTGLYHYKFYGVCSWWLLQVMIWAINNGDRLNPILPLHWEFDKDEPRSSLTVMQQSDDPISDGAGLPTSRNVGVTESCGLSVTDIYNLFLRDFT